MNRLRTRPPSTVTREPTGTTPSTPPRHAPAAPTSIRHAGGPLTALAHLTRHGGPPSPAAPQRGSPAGAGTPPDRPAGGRLAATRPAGSGIAPRPAAASDAGEAALADGESVHAAGRRAHGAPTARLLAPPAAAARLPLRTRRRRHDPNEIFCDEDEDEDRAWQWQPSEFEFNAFSKDLLGASGTVHLSAGSEVLLPNSAAYRPGETAARPAGPAGARAAADAAGQGAPSEPSEPGEIRSVDDLKRFVMETGRAGVSVELGHSTVSPHHEMLYGYHGLVYHGAAHSPREIRAAGGLFSGKPLDVDAHLLEAQGLADPKGATGEAGISTSKLAAGALARAAAAASGSGRAYVYVIDTRRFDAADQAYDLTRILVEAGHLPAGQDPDGHDDPTGAEVNATHIADAAIVGWVALDDVRTIAERISQATPQARARLLGELVRDNAARVQLNDGRATMDD
ncbi:hypothetical protein [Burkholderia glumae]|uniref:hypothetical protein n=1 Tax=Burkholderia glumae TaxID=337 RepID=UPI0012FD7D15|nr:hypothetical protein [Burkholderia glumae]QHE11782.1 hypothetical protein GQR88_16130 [Burkholderia glumae AU6208]